MAKSKKQFKVVKVGKFSYEPAFVGLETVEL
jgi:hypothetical protein